MGEANYYLKARFKDDAAAAEALPKIKAFIAEGIRAGDWWQAHRDLERDGRRHEFWNSFATEFPLVYKYLGMFRAADGDCNNALAGLLDFGASEDYVEDVNQDGAVLSYGSGSIWHFTDWSHFMDFLQSEFGAVKTTYCSDEYMDPMDVLHV